jgi:hypothetical protein
MLTMMPTSIAVTIAICIASGAFRIGTAPIDAMLMPQPMRMNSRVRSTSSSRIASAAVVSDCTATDGVGLSTTVASPSDIGSVYRDAEPASR